jgi:hypothetical protein
MSSALVGFVTYHPVTNVLTLFPILDLKEIILLIQSECLIIRRSIHYKVNYYSYLSFRTTLQLEA